MVKKKKLSPAQVHLIESVGNGSVLTYNTFSGIFWMDNSRQILESTFDAVALCFTGESDGKGIITYALNEKGKMLVS